MQYIDININVPDRFFVASLNLFNPSLEEIFTLHIFIIVYLVIYDKKRIFCIGYYEVYKNKVHENYRSLAL